MNGDDFKSLSRRSMLALLLGGAAQGAFAQGLDTSPRPLMRDRKAAKRIEPDARALAAGTNLSGQVSFTVADAATGKVLESYNALLALPPASVAKALTAVYGIETLGPDHRFETSLRCTGPIENSVLQGDLILQAGGDPTLDSEDLDAMAAKLAAMGVTYVTGRFLVYDGALPLVDRIDAGQPDHVAYNPAVSGMNLNFNRVHLEWKKNGDSYDTTMQARAGPVRPDVDFAKINIVDRRAPVFQFDPDPNRDVWSVARSALGGAGSRWLPVRQPRVYAGEVFRTLARAHGMIVPRAEIAPLLGPSLPIVTHRSPKLAEIAQGMLRYSTNLTAEVIGLSASRASDVVDGLDGSAARMNGWLSDKYGARRPNLVDHSGLGGTSMLTSHDMVRALTGKGVGDVLRPILKPLSMAGQETDKHPDPAIQIAAKTGTLNFVSGLAGYIKAPGGRDLAFATFIADVPRREAIPREQRERPRGAKGWNNRARRLQRDLIRRWIAHHDLA